MLVMVFTAGAALGPIYSSAPCRGNDRCRISPVPSTRSAPKRLRRRQKRRAANPFHRCRCTDACLCSGNSGTRHEEMNDVRAAWVCPKRTESIKGVEIWYYDGPSGNTRGVRFDRTGTVLAVTEMEELPVRSPRSKASAVCYEFVDRWAANVQVLAARTDPRSHPQPRRRARKSPHNASASIGFCSTSLTPARSISASCNLLAVTRVQQHRQPGSHGAGGACELQPGPCPGHRLVGQHEIECLAGFHGVERCAGIRKRDHGKAPLREQVVHEAEDRGLIIDDRKLAHGARRVAMQPVPPPVAAPLKRDRLRTEPVTARESSPPVPARSPPRYDRRARARCHARWQAHPAALPTSLVVKNGSNIRSTTSDAIPGPSSSTESSTKSPAPTAGCGRSAHRFDLSDANMDHIRRRSSRRVR